MASPTTLRTPYDIRVDMVKDAIKATPSEDGRGLAVHVLHALNSIPEKVR